MIMRTLTSSLAAVVLSAGMAAAAPIDLSTWSSEGQGTWNVQTSNDAVLQTTNGRVTVFHDNKTSSQGNDLRGQITVGNTTDDDFIGFVLGYNAGDLTNAAASYLLVDWKQGYQNDPSWGIGNPGLSISRVTGALTDAAAWSHDSTNGVTELARGTGLGSTGWVENQTYDFKIDFSATNVKVFVDDVLEIDVNGMFADGGFGFYNLSQDNVTYAGITSDVIPDPNVVPLPAAAWMLLAGLGSLAAIGRRKLS